MKIPNIDPNNLKKISKYLKKKLKSKNKALAIYKTAPRTYIRVQKVAGNIINQIKRLIFLQDIPWINNLIKNNKILNKLRKIS